jgi:succinylglutamic semialdehyde dehydrogenase
MLCIAGLWREGRGSEFLRDDPSTGRTVWRGRTASAADVDDAFAAARKAFDGWSDTPLAERVAIARACAAILKARSEALATTIARDTGKPLPEARAEVGTMTAKVELSIAALHERAGSREQATAFGRHRLEHRPHGVVAVFGPYNFPGHLPNGHIVPALLAGNAVLFKPSELTPMTAAAMVAAWHDAGLPPGVLNLLQGERDTGMAVAGHPELDGLYFTGSSRTGALLARQFAERPGVILALEMGGNNPLVVGSHCDIPAAVELIVQSAWITSGQRCTCARRLLVADDAAGDALVAALVTAAAALSIGPAESEPAPFMGPVVSGRVADQLLAVQQSLLDAGATALLPMRRLPLGAAFLTPGLLDVTAIRAQLPDEEHFGPLLKLIRYSSFDEALALARDTRYGLSAGLLGDDDEEWQRFRKAARAGIVNRNRPTTGASGAYPFGGIGASGNHRASAWYAADYCAYPVASTEADRLLPPPVAPP